MSNDLQWCDLTLDQWSEMTADQWAAMLACEEAPPSDAELLLYEGLLPITIAPASASRGFMRDVASDYSAPASDQTSHSVDLSSGSFVWSRELLSMPSIGAFRWSFGLNYRQDSGISDILGPDFSYPQLSRLDFGFKPYRQEIIADRPIAYWKLDDAAASTARDEMLQLSASYPAGASVGEIGAISDGGTAAEFYGGGPFLVGILPNGVPAGSANPLDFDPQAQEFSIEAWFRLPQQDQDAYLLAKGDDTSAQYLVKVSVSGSHYTLTANVGGASLATTLSLDDDYHHILLVNRIFATTDGEANLRFNLYVDGVGVASGDPDDLIAPDLQGLNWTAAGTARNSNPVTFAAGTDIDVATVGSLSGWLDELAVYDHALPLWRITAHATVGALGTGANGDHPPIRLISSQFTTTVFIWTNLNGGQYADPTARSSSVLQPVGSPAASYILLSPDGTKTTFNGPTASAPGRMISVTDRHGNTQQYEWDSALGGALIRLTTISDPYNRQIIYSYYGSETAYQLKQIDDFAGRTTRFQYDDQNRLAAVILPAVTLGANDTSPFPAGTAFAFGYDDTGSAQSGYLNRIWYPNETLPYLAGGLSASLDTAAVSAGAEPRYFVTFGDGSNPAVPHGRVASQRVGSEDGTVGGSYVFNYAALNPPMANNFDPFDPITFKTWMNDPNSNAAGSAWTTINYYNRNRQPVRVEVYPSRSKSSESPVGPYITLTQFNAQNQPVEMQYPLGNMTSFRHETGIIPQSGESSSAFLHALRRGLLQKETHSAAGETDLTRWQAHDPIFNLPFATTDFRGQATQSVLDYQQYAQDDSQLTSLVSNYLQNLPSPTSAFNAIVSGLEGTLATAGLEAFVFGVEGIASIAGVALAGLALQTNYPSPGTDSRRESFTYNPWGQPTTHTDAVGTISTFQYYSDSDPTGINGTLGGNPRGMLKSTTVDVDPGSIASFTPIISRLAQPPYLALQTTVEYDALGNVTQSTDAKGRVSSITRNERGQAFKTTVPAPYGFQTETYFDANGNVIRHDIEDQVVDTGGDDTSGFTPELPDDTTANLPLTSGDGGTVRPGWFTTKHEYDLLDRAKSEFLDCLYAVNDDGTITSGSGITTLYKYDPNGNLIQLTKPQGNLVDFDYDERNLQIAKRAGGANGAVAISTYDAHGKPMNVIGPFDQDRNAGTNYTSMITINNPFGGGGSLSFNADWTTQNVYDGHERIKQTIDAIGNNMTIDQFDPNGRILQQSHNGVTGGSNQTTRAVSDNHLSQVAFIYDDAGRKTSETLKCLDGSGPDLTTSYKYDVGNRITTITHPNHGVTTYDYDSIGRVLKETDPAGNLLEHEYDNVGNVTKTTRTEKSAVRSLRNGDGEVFVSRYRYDVLNRLVVSSQQGADGTLSLALDDAQTLHTLNGFDSRGNRTITVDPAGKVLAQGFDEASRMISTTQYSGGEPIITQRKLDANGRLIGLVDANSNTTRFTFDLQDRPLLAIYPAAGTSSSASSCGWDYTAHDAATGPLKYTDCNGADFEYTLDGIGRRTQLDVTPFDDSTIGVMQRWEYDGLSRVIGLYDQAAALSGDGWARITFDSLGRTTSDKNAGDQAVSYDQFQQFSPGRMTYPSSRTIICNYDVLYNVTSTVEGSTGKSIVDWRYVGPGRLSDAKFGNGLQCLYRNNTAIAAAFQAGDTAPVWGDADTDRIGYDGSGRLVSKRYIGPPSRGIGQYQNMTLQAVSQNQRGWNFQLAEPIGGVAAVGDATLGCCTPTDLYLSQTHQLSSNVQIDWDTVSAPASEILDPPSSDGTVPPQQGMIDEMIDPNSAAIDCVRGHDL